MPRILVVDDDENVRVLVEYLLKEDGHEVIIAVDGLDALAKLGIDPPGAAAPLPDVVFTDVKMPGLDGYSLCARLAQEPRTKGIPVVVMTTKGTLRELFESATSIVAFLEKPFGQAVLRETLAKALKPRA